jgi:flavin-dependent dehydrogenase
MKHADVVIIGGSLAGAACARELTRRGVDAVAVERDSFPREKVCGGFLSPAAVDLLDELGVLADVRAVGAVSVTQSRVRMRGREMSASLPRPGLGISRKALDAVMADHPSVQHGVVHSVQRHEKEFCVDTDSGKITARVVIDAAGKLSRFTRRRTVPQFGVQFYEEQSRGDCLDFWFFDGGYGGAVSVEGGRSNACFLINKDMVRKLGESRTEGYRVTGPVAYDRLPSEYIAIGDAAGMVDPFCGEGMRHALDTGIRAAAIVADGLAQSRDYDQIRHRYESNASQRWSRKRRLGRLIRAMLKHPHVLATGFRLHPEYWFRKLWD